MTSAGMSCLFLFLDQFDFAERRLHDAFTGLTTDAAIAEQTAALRAWMGSNELSGAGQPSLHRYNDPFTLPWRRRNEVHVEVRPERCAAPSPGSFAGR